MFGRPGTGMAMAEGYRSDLAYIHHVGFGSFARSAAPWLLKSLRQTGASSGLVVDLGCGSGIWAAELLRAGYRVLGVDQSQAMVDLAYRNAPRGEFRAQSYLRARLPPCIGVTALGECFNYLFDERNTAKALARLFRRVIAALRPGGVFAFDVAGPGRVPGAGHVRKFAEGENWAVFVDAVEDRRRRTLTRSITSFRKVGLLYRRDFEVHRMRLFTRSEIAQLLREAGFRIRSLAGYGRLKFARGHFGFLAAKPVEPDAR
jgi:SAM-dependent methyltransferase